VETLKGGFELVLRRPIETAELIRWDEKALGEALNVHEGNELKRAFWYICRSLDELLETFRVLGEKFSFHME
jgi:hypothetical protein